MNRHMAVDDEEHEKKCAGCHSLIHVGRDLIRVQEGVLGTRGFVDLNHELLFCNENCVRDYYADSEVVEMKRRIP